ncbi:MAG: SulP family inorganic anion transporter, partial [Salibacteraceae bacterium]
MNNLDNLNNPFKHLGKDLPAGIVVFLVAVPLCLGIALASEAPPIAGIIAGLVGGIIVGALSGSSLGVSGPAAGLVSIVVLAIKDLGFEVFLLAVVLAGVLQIVAGFARGGIIAYFFPTSVIKGMLAGIGVLIFLKEIPHAMGYDKDHFGDFSFFQTDGHNTISELYYAVVDVTPGAVIITVISLAVLILFEQKFIKQNKVLGLLPGPLLAVLVGVGLKIAFDGTDFNISKDHLVALPVTDGFDSFLALFTFPDWSGLANPKVYTTAFVIALVASIETLLCVEATDKIDPFKRITPTNRELKAQGVGNMVSGLLGGLPVTQVIVRSSANIQTGGVTKASAVFHGLLILVCVATIPALLNQIPYASLAAILLVVGYKLAKPALFKSMYAGGWLQFIPFVVTVFMIVATNLLVGIGIGLAVAIFFILFDNFRQPYYLRSGSNTEGNSIHLELTENVSFLNKAHIQQTLDHLPDNCELAIDATRTRHVHPDVLEILEDFEVSAKMRGITITMKGLEDKPGAENPL